MSNTSTRFLFTAVWLAAVFTALTLGFPTFWTSEQAGRTAPASALGAAAGAVAPDTTSSDAPASGLSRTDPAVPGLLPSLAAPGSPVRRARRGHESAIRPDAMSDAAVSGSVVPDSVVPATRVVPSLADRLVIEAQTASAAGQHAAAADALRRLAVERPLTLDESRWLAGEHDAAGHHAEALVAYYAIANQVGDEPATWERIGDLELQNGRPQNAAAAYARLDTARRTSGVWVKVARTAAAAGETDAALSAYRSALGDDPAAASAIALEAARYAASVNRPVLALDFYARQTTPGRTLPDVQLEMAQAALAANRPVDALRLTSAARAAGDHTIELRYAHAQALHMTGQPGTAATIFRALQAERPDDPRFVAWRARTAQAEGRHLDAYELFSEALTTEASADVLLARGDVSAARGDVARARADYARAQAAGAEEPIVRERLGRLDTTPQLSLPFEYLRDANGIELTAQTARLDLWTKGPFRLAARWLTGRVRQQTTSFATQSGAVDLDSWWITPRLSVAGSAGFSEVAAKTMPAWNGTARYAWTEGGSVAVRSSRQTPWSGDPSRELMRFNRVNDLAGVGAAFDAVTFGGELNVPLGARRGIRADLATREYSDGNTSRDLFLQFQQVVANGSTWVAVQPHVYVERWAHASSAYYSPDQHVTTGVTLRAIGRQGIWTFDTGVTPQLLASNGRTGVGASLTGGLRAQIGGASVGANVMLFDDRRYSYNLRRVVADVRIPVGK